MLFDIKPKTHTRDLFGADYLLNVLTKSIKDENVRMIVIRGLRRTGKTSLLNVALEESKADYIKIDVRESPYYDRTEFLRFLIERLEEKCSKLKMLLSSELKVSYKDFGISLKPKDMESSFFGRLNSKLEKKNRHIVIAFDEIQLLKKTGFDQILASIYDNYGRIRVIITGSEIGILDEFIGKDSKSPLFGRPYREFETKRLEKEKSAEFLMGGLEQINKKLEVEEIEEATGELDGIIGWLTFYGWFRSQNMNHKDALIKTIEEGKKLARSELEKFLGGRKAKAKYLFILKTLAKNKNTWETIKSEFERSGKKTSDRQLSLYLNELADYGFIEKENKKYIISDPIYVRAVEE